ncbi:hypothetical protein [Micromonospora sp. CPCC 206061]|uniref:hypothetical protein n=1 Tax=Micromonospora sp. CPCC 206061 TaxID=3122410 RepID=UPI002FF36C5E
MPNTTDRRGWETGTTPWVRQQPPGTRFLCYFCGATSAILSFGDHPDPGRIEVYCDNTGCDARTVAVLVLQDGTSATPERADVRALEAIDNPDRPRAGNIRELLAIQTSSAEVVARRQSRP